MENAELRARFEELNKQLIYLKQKQNFSEEQTQINLKGKLHELNSQIRSMDEQKTKLIRKSMNR